ncbi:MAG TPA: class I SAM-dependent methyltransferase [Vicinamibacterales bacterium]|nr:class I SAM-dependent methyltransferase [Vicinamibacterales bacterium]
MDFRSIFGRRPPEPQGGGDLPPSSDEPAYPTKALAKFLKLLQARANPALLDLGPVVGTNVTFFGEHLGCRIRVEDIAADVERHVKEDKLDALPAFFGTRFQQEAESVDGVLCWDVFDFLERPAAHALANALMRLLRPDGALLGFFSTTESRAQVHTKFMVVDENSLRYRTYAASRPRQKVLLNRDINKMFEGLRVTESFLMKNNVREILFKKPAYLTPPTP